MREFEFSYNKDLSAGRVIFQVRNEGGVAHRLTLVRLPEDFPSLEEQLRGQDRRGVPPFAGVLPRRPRESGSFAVDLVPGQRYGMFCLVQTSDGEPHARKGMNSEFRIGESSTLTGGG